MKYIKFIIWGIIVIPVFVFAIAFGVQNQEPITINLLFLKFESVKLGFGLLVVFLAGVLLGLFFALPGLVSNVQNRRLKKHLKTHKEELDRLKSAGFRESS